MNSGCLTTVRRRLPSHPSRGPAQRGSTVGRGGLGADTMNSGCLTTVRRRLPEPPVEGAPRSGDRRSGEWGWAPTPRTVDASPLSGGASRATRRGAPRSGDRRQGERGSAPTPRAMDASRPAVTPSVTPAKAGVQSRTSHPLRPDWIPAFAGMTGFGVAARHCIRRSGRRTDERDRRPSDERDRRVRRAPPPTPVRPRSPKGCPPQKFRE